MKKGLIIILIFLFAFKASSQSFSKIDFVNTEWFSDNLDSLFFKSDTVKLIKYSNLISNKNGYNEYAESEIAFLQHGYYIHLQFNKFGNMHFWNTKYDLVSKSKIGERTWKFIKNENILRIFFNGRLEFEFKLLSLKDIHFNSKYNSDKPITTVELILKKNK